MDEQANANKEVRPTALDGEDRHRHALLRQLLHRLDCPSGEDLFLFQAGKLAGSRMREVRDHLKMCASCRAESQFFGEDVFAQTELNRSSSQLPFLERVQVFVAQALRIPANMQPALRGGRKLIGMFHIEEKGWDLVLEQGEGSTDFTLYGSLMMPEPEPNIYVELFRLGSNELLNEVQKETVVDETGWFVLADLSMGQYVLRLEADQFRIEVAQVEITSLNP